jgi:hypothetical protein
MQDPSRDVRERALHLVDLMGPDARAAIPLLERELADPDLHIRLSAARLLARMEPRNEKLIDTLIALAKDPTSEISESSVEVLRSLEPRDARIQHALLPYDQRDRRKRVEKAWADSTPEQRAENARTLKVQAIHMAAEMNGTEPQQVERSFPSYMSPITCWTEVSVSSAPAALHHVWLLDGKVRADNYLEVLAPVDRLWSRHPVKPGRWKVEVRSESSSEPLATIAFSVYAAERPAKPKHRAHKP